MVMTETLPNIFDNVCKEIGLSVIGTSVQIHDNRVELHGLGANNRVPIEELERLRRMKYPDWQEWGEINTRENMIESGNRYLEQMIDIAIDHELAWMHDDNFMEIHITSLDFWQDLGHVYTGYQTTLEHVASNTYPNEVVDMDCDDTVSFTNEEAQELSELLYYDNFPEENLEPLNLENIFNEEEFRAPPYISIEQA